MLEESQVTGHRMALRGAAAPIQRPAPVVHAAGVSHQEDLLAAAPEAAAEAEVFKSVDKPLIKACCHRQHDAGSAERVDGHGP